VAAFNKNDIVTIVYKIGENRDSGPVIAEVVEIGEVSLIFKKSNGDLLLVPFDNLYYMKKQGV